MKTRISTLCVLISAVIIFTSVYLYAEDDYIKIRDFTSYQEIIGNEAAVISWDFENADFVTISGSTTRYEPKDKIELYPTASTIVEIFAYKDSDHISLKSYIYKAGSEDESVRKGPTLAPYDEMSHSYVETPFLNGVMAADLSQPPYKLKIMRTKLKDNINMDFHIRALVLDRFGNYITGLKKSDKKTSWLAHNKCKNINEEPVLVALNKYKEVNRVQTDDALDLSFVIDNSSAAKSNQKVFSLLKEFFGLLSPYDHVTLGYFNQDYKEYMKMIPADDAANQLEAGVLPSPSGMNSLYKALYKNINDFETRNKKALILITHMADNSSIIYTANDAANYALSEDLPVYIIGIGDAVDSYALQYITTLTGGKYYHIFNGELQTLPEILREISFAQKAYYEVDVPLTMQLQNCTKLNTEITSVIDANKAFDDVDLIIKPQIQYSQYQVAAVFNERSSVLDDEYQSVIISISKVLTDNPSAVIELIGNTSLKEKGASDKLAMQRAEKVKEELMAYGASPNQIRVRSDGASRPRYYLEMYDWQSKLNRRVEVRWLYPSMLPYEILAEKAETEQEAIEIAEKWEKRGEMAYYERYLEKGEIMYRVKIWGYRTLSEAKQAANDFRKKYNIRPEVQ